MKRTAAAALVTTLALVVPARAQETARFRTGTDAVAVEASVRRERRPVQGLKAADFELLDNGVRQQITSVTAETLPVDVTLVVDTSGSVIRSLDRFKADVRQIGGALNPNDEVRLVTFDTSVKQVFPMQPASRRLPVDEIKIGNMTSLIDAVTFALARAPRPDRRHLLFVFTDGYDNASMLGYQALPALVGHTDVILNVVLSKVSGVPDTGAPAALDALAAAAARTGGVLYPPSDELQDVVEAFKQTLDAFRHSYVLYYSPTDVDPAGWHEISVRVTRPGTYDVQARQKYFGG
jgi:VWFA-related protein